MNAIIRKARQTDYRQLCKLFKEENRYHEKLVPEYINATDDVLTEGELKDFIEKPDQNLFVCELDSHLLGAVIVGIVEEGNGRWLKTRLTGKIEELIVTENSRGKRIGSRLMEAAAGWLTSRGVDSLELHVWHVNTRAKKFYRSMGFQSVQHKMSVSVKDLLDCK